MILPEDPPGFVVRTELHKAAFENGFRLDRGHVSGWLRYGSTTAHGEIWVAGASQNGPWMLSVGLREVVVEMEILPSPAVLGPGAATYVFGSLRDLYTALDQTYRLGISLPDAPLQQFHA